MKKRNRFLIILAVVLLAMTMSPQDVVPRIVNADEIEDQLAAGNYVEGEAIAAIRTDARQIQERTEHTYEVTELVSVDPSAVQEESQDDQSQSSTEGLAYSVKGTSSLSAGIELCLVSSDRLSTGELLRRLAENPDVIFAEPNYTFRPDDERLSVDFTLAAKESAEYNPPEQTDADLTDDLTDLQWGNWSTEQTVCAQGMAENPSINVPGFGATGQDGNMEKPVTVALLDTGVYYEHPDLKNVLYHFTPEQQAALGCWEWGYNAVGKGKYGNVCDEESIAHGHGTHTAGIIGAEWNGSGTSGVASNVRIVCIEIADDKGNESLADSLAAFAFINRFNEQVPEDERIVVTSNSWSEYSSSRALDAVLRDLGDRWGIVSVFSAGNDGKNNDRYEKTPSSSADNPYVIVVANSAANDRLYSSSEFGTATVDLAAPGTNILSTTTPDRGFFFPDAMREDSLVYLGFDGQDQLNAKVSQVYRDGQPSLYEEEEIVSENISAVTDAAHFFGKNCLRIEVDPQYLVEEAPWREESQSYDLQFDIDIEGTDIASRLDGMNDLQLSMAYASEKDSSSLINIASSNTAFITENVPVKSEDGEETIVEVTRPTASYSMTLSAW